LREDQVPPSPVVANWELVLRLRERREQLGLGIKDITDTLGFTRNYWSAIENERKIIPANTLRSLFDILEFDDAERHQLVELREVAKTRSWWNKYSALFDEKLQRLYGLERGAQAIRGYDTLLIPSMLQTADYARAIISNDITVRQVEVEQRVEVRLLRQQRLNDENPLELKVILSEAALKQQVGGPAVLKDQLSHLLHVIEQHPNNVDIRVIPFTATPCNLLTSGTLHLLDFQSPRLPRAAWTETVMTWSIVTDPNQVREITMVFNDALERTLGHEESKTIIERYRKELH
jgi:transcriptional regulator with XRE-family HTH domain